MARGITRRKRHPLFDADEARADYVHASQCGFWTNEEAAAFAMGYNPKFLNPSAVEAHLAGTDESEEFLRRLDLIERAAKMGDLNERFRPTEFVSWAKSIRIELPAELTAAVGLPTADRDQDNERIAELKAEVETLKAKCAAQERLIADPHPRRKLGRDIVITGMAENAYGFKREAPRNKATSAIRSDIEKSGLSLDDATILDILRDATKVNREPGSVSEWD